MGTRVHAPLIRAPCPATAASLQVEPVMLDRLLTEYIERSRADDAASAEGSEELGDGGGGGGGGGDDGSDGRVTANNNGGMDGAAAQEESQNTYYGKYGQQQAGVGGEVAAEESV